MCSKKCTGHEKTVIANLPEIASYTGYFPSPLQVMWYTPERSEMFKLKISDTEIRRLRLTFYAIELGENSDNRNLVCIHYYSACLDEHSWSQPASYFI